MRLTTRRLSGFGVALAVTALVAAACGGSSSPTVSTSSSASAGASAGVSPSKDAAAAAKVPAAIASKGTLVVAADASYAPDEFFAPDGHTVIGMDPDLAQAIGAVLGLKIKVVNATFATIIPGLQAGHYDLGMSSFTDNKDREKTVDFVTYFTAGESFFTLASGGVTIGSIADICGHKVAVEKGTTEEADAQTQSKACTKSGKPAVNVISYGTQSEANLALSSGRAELGFADSPVAGYQVEQSGGKFKLVGASYANAPYGIAIPKNNGMAAAVLAAVKDLMANGDYTKILTKWGLQSGAISNPVINGATS